MKEMYCTLVRSVCGVLSTFILAAIFVGADTLVPHKYVVIQDGKEHYSNKIPEVEETEE